MRFKQFIQEWSQTDPRINAYLQKKGYKYLGKGVDQTAYLEKSTGKVLKIFGTQENGKQATAAGYTKDHLMFKRWAEYCEKHKSNEFLPKFDGWEGFEYDGNKYLQIRMEKLQKLPWRLSAALHELTEYLGDTGKRGIIELMKNVHDLLGDNEDGDVNIDLGDNLSHEEAEEIEKLVVLLGEKQFRLLLDTIVDLAHIASENSYDFDLHGDNFMHRNDGIPVIVDPWVT